MARSDQTDPAPSRSWEEMAKAGSQHAAHAVATLLRVPVRVATLRVRCIDVLEIAASPEAAGEVSLGVHFTIYGERAGIVLVMVSRQHACRLADLLRKQPPGTTTVLDEQALSIVRETANILTGAYLHAIRSVVNRPLIHSIPYLAMDHREVIVNSLLPSVAEGGERAWLIEAELTAEGSDGLCFLLVIVAGEWAP